MNLHLALHYGQCFGVRDAVALTRDQATARAEPLHVLGQLAHNPAVRADLAAVGARETALADVPKLPPGSRVIISAHGVSQRTRAELARRRLHVTDATCPLVHRAHQALRELVAAGNRPAIIGQAGHVEVEGLRGDYPDALVLLQDTDLERLPWQGQLGVVAQTTQPLPRVEALLQKVKALRPRLRVTFRDTVCRPTKDRQAALRELARRCEVVLVVGGRNSNNSRQLASTAETLGAAAYLVENAREIQARWFEHAEDVGLTAGTSTPEANVREVETKLRHIAAAKRRGLLLGCAR
ncbi:MAG: 4-hydroxy-3-methylbut-2-enyl diphosphate reductase [Verrucomicrobiota bacterium]